MMNNEKKNTRKFDLEDRFYAETSAWAQSNACRSIIDFAIRVSEVAESLPNTALGKYIKGQSIETAKKNSRKEKM